MLPISMFSSRIANPQCTQASLIHGPAEIPSSVPHAILPDRVWQLLAKASDISSQPIDCSIKEKATLLAKHATMSRFLTCLLNEGLVLGNIMVGLPPTTSLGDGHQPLKLLALRERNISSHAEYEAITTNVNTAKYLVLLKRFPIVRDADKSRSALIDPLDFTSVVVDISALELVTDVGAMMKQVSAWNNYDQNVIHGICLEMANSIEHQAYRYAHPSPIKLNADSPLIDWEQSIVEGHPIHPMHRMRYTVSPTQPISPATDLYNINLRYTIVPKAELIISGDFSDLTKPLYASHLDRLVQDGIEFNQESDLIVPVHEYQIPNVQLRFPNIRILPEWFATPCKVQSSIRTLNYIGYDKYCIKLPLGVKLTSAFRTITPWTTFLGPRINPLLDAVIADKDVLIAMREPASISSSHPDFDIAKHLSCIVRDDAQYQANLRNEHVALSVTLTESLPSATRSNGRELPFMHRIWGNRLTTSQGKLDFFKEYATVYLKAFLPPVIHHGFTFEAHQQNALVRFDKNTLRITGFIIRDYGGIRYYPPALQESTRHLPNGPIEINTFPGHCIKAKSIDVVYRTAFHSMIQSHLHTVIKSLGLFRADEGESREWSDGCGWKITRDILHQMIPKNHDLHKLWLQSTEVKSKALLTMQTVGNFREHAYADIPNVILYNEDSEEKRVRTA